MQSREETKPKLIVRPATLHDVPGIHRLSIRVYGESLSLSRDMIIGQIHNFPEGQFVALYEDLPVGYCATFRIKGYFALRPHTWNEITGGGFASRHDPDGDYLYGMEVFVDPNFRGWRIGQRLYDARKQLCKDLELRGIVFAGRLPGLARKIRQAGSAEAYLDLVKRKKIRDSVAMFQMKNGFEIIGILKDYLPSDHESLGYAAHMAWHNPEINEENFQSYHSKIHIQRKIQSFPERVRVSVVQYQQRKVDSFQEFCKYVEYFVDVVSDYKADFVTFPELFTLQLLSITDQKLSPAEAIDALTNYTNPIKKFLNELAVQYNINIVGGSHPTKNENGDVMNVCYVCLRDGSIHEQVKIHPTPNERFWWHIQGGDEVNIIPTDCGPIGVMICYDSEFPELARHLVDQGAYILFVPFCTDERKSYMRVRYCSHARAIENQCYVVMAGNVGNLPGVENMDIQYAQSCILTPCDFPFALDGVAADCTPNVEMVTIADLRIGDLISSRNSGTVQNLKDRRYDLYTISWKEKKKEREQKVGF
ncbi:MAG: GNAT family N-acetyltransferase [bacterium]|jgi:predicted amidohydrolase/GNAT superfamily N-acetyltransferase|nr:GNAT family N-acetyltransferase [bacterium]